MSTDLTLLLLSSMVSVPTSSRPMLLKLVPVFSISLQYREVLFVLGSISSLFIKFCPWSPVLWSRNRPFWLQSHVKKKRLKIQN